jgi:hypothetical protein
MSEYEEPYEDDEYDDYQEEDKFDKFKHYFKFDMSWFSKIDFSSFKIFPVNYSSDAGGKPNFLYLGNNIYKEPIFKKQFFVHDKLYSLYKNHISSNAAHFIKQPSYYKGMFDILN